MHSFYLLFSFCSCNVQSLVLLLNSSNLFLDFLLPIFSLVLFTFLAFSFEFAYLIDFSLLFNFEYGLFNCLSQQDIQDWLHFSIIVKQIIVLNLSDFIDTSLLRDVGRCGRFRNELISLNLNFDFFRTLLPLFS